MKMPQSISYGLEGDATIFGVRGDDEDPLLPVFTEDDV
jgi:hypothetical protein